MFQNHNETLHQPTYIIVTFKKKCVFQNAGFFSIHTLSDLVLPTLALISIQGTWPALPTRGMEKFQPLSSPRKAETSSSFGRVLRLKHPNRLTEKGEKSPAENIAK